MKIAQLKGNYLSTPFPSVFLGMSYNTTPSTNLYVYALQVNIYSLTTQKLVSCLSVQEPKSKGTLLLNAQYIVCQLPYEYGMTVNICDDEALAAVV